MGKTTVKRGNPYLSEGGRMPSTTSNPSGGKRGNNTPMKNVKSIATSAMKQSQISKKSESVVVKSMSLNMHDFSAKNKKKELKEIK